jgi:hypothetical protein
MTEEGFVDGTARKHRYQLFLAVESHLLLVAVVGSAAMLTAGGSLRWAAVLLSALWVWHVVAIPIGFLYLIGKPIVMTLSPLIPSAESRAFRRQLRDRPVLGDEEFYARYYEASVVPREIPVRLRRLLLDLDPLTERVLPSDRLYLLNDDLDFADVLYLIEREFGIDFTRADHQLIDGTLDQLIRLVHMRLSLEAR